jgi:Protein of unknown function (DUF3592)
LETRELVTRLVGNREKILRYAWIPQILTGIVLLGLAHFMGHSHFELIRHGVRALGRIVSYKQENFRRSSGSFSTGYMPVVEFHTNDRFVQFRDWLGTSIAGSTNVSVIVLYDPANPSMAMIDRPIGNWLPWAPIFAVGFFLVLVAIKGALRSLI